MRLTCKVSGSGLSLVSGKKRTRTPAKRENIENIIIGTMGSVTSERIAIYEETPEPKRAIWK